jgi:hypothetical protein
MTSLSSTPSLVAISADLVGMQVAVLEGGDLALGLAQVEEQLLLRGGRAHLHQRPRAQDVFLDRGADPPHGVGGQAEALVGLELLDGLHQADIAFGDHFADRQAVAAIAHGDLGHETQVAGDHLVGGGGVLMLFPTLGEHELLVLGQHRELADLGEVTRQAAVRRHHR